ncbi:Formin-like protein 6 [Hibiscus syriacus]|uniref:Formin-like protein n=1 Tax=Hibiscus syriacus TaxID=106335 RepID=A0A6A3A7L4_HIBSY|nr:Formin-like protein 6 [Hibiscus syriacus]
MTLLSRFFYRRPPDGLLEFVERVYVFDSCFSTEVLPDGMYQVYLHEIVTELHEEFPESSFLAFNFREGEKPSSFAEILCQFDVAVLDYPRQYEGCPLLPLSLIQHFLCVCESWLSVGNHQNVILLHCERGGWPLLAFLLASFLIFKKLHSGERKTLEIVHREAPKGFLQLLSPLNPYPSQLRYLQYIARRNITPEWPPPERALSLDCIILRAIPSFDAQNGCRPIIRIFGRNLHNQDGLSTQMLFSMSKKRKVLRHYRQVDCDVIKIDIQCLVQGDVVLECVHLDLDPEREVMMFRVMFNTAFIRSNILMLNSENLDILWDSKERFPKGFRVEVLFGKVENSSPPKAPITVLNGEEKGGLPIEAFSRVQELFSGVEWVDNSDDAALWLLKQLSVLSDVKELSRLQNKGNLYASPADSEEENNASSTADSSDEAFDVINKPLVDPTSSLLPDIGDTVPLHSENDSLQDLDHASVETVQVVSSSGMPSHLSSPMEPLGPHVPTPPELPLIPSESLSLGCTPHAPPPPPPPPPLHLPSSVNTIRPKSSPPPPPPLPPTLLSFTSEELLPTPPPPALSSQLLSPPMPPPLPPPLPPSLHPPSSGSKSKKQTSYQPPQPPPPPPPRAISTTSFTHRGPAPTLTPPPPPPPPMATSTASSSHKGPTPPPPPMATSTASSSHRGPAPPPPPPPPPMATSTASSSHKGPTPPPPPAPMATSTTNSSHKGPAPPVQGHNTSVPRPPPPPPLAGPARSGSVPPPPPAPKAPIVPPPPPSSGTRLPSAKVSNVPPPPPPSSGRGKSLGQTGHGRGRVLFASNTPKKNSLKPLHWVKVTRAMQGSLWADSQKQDNQSRPPEIDMSELESLFSAASVSNGSSTNKLGGRRGSNINKPEKVQLIDLRRAYNCEIMLTKIKIPLPDMISAILALDSSVLDIDQVENLIKFCPTKEEMELLKNYTGDKAMLGKCEQFFLELMKVPRVESKLRVFAFRITFSSQVDELRSSLSIINHATAEVKESVKLRQIMQTILTLGNALNQGTARGSAVGFKLDSLLKLSDTRARNNKMTLMHYLCKLLSEKMPELLDFDKDLVHLEAASKIQLKNLAEEMQAVSKGLEKVEQELTASDNDGDISLGFQKVLKNFLDTAEAEVRSLISLYSEVGRNADSLSQYFGEDPARCPFEQVTQILVVFVKMFKKSREENEKLADAEKKKLEKEAMKERAAVKKDGADTDEPNLTSQILKHTLRS